MSKSLGQPFVIDNRPGAGGNVGTLQASKATPDGYTLVGTGSGPIAANKTLYKDLGYDPEKDFEAISLFAHFPIVVVASTKLPVKTLTELIAHAKERPNQLNYGSVGIGSSQHLVRRLFRAGRRRQAHPRAVSQHRAIRAGPDRRHGAARLPVAAERGRAAQQRRRQGAGGRRQDAHDGAAQRADHRRGRPAGLRQRPAGSCCWRRKGTPKPIVAKLNKELTAAIVDPAVRARFTEQGARSPAATPEELTKLISAEIAKWRDIITKAGIAQIQ